MGEMKNGKTVKAEELIRTIYKFEKWVKITTNDQFEEFLKLIQELGMAIAQQEDILTPKKVIPDWKKIRQLRKLKKISIIPMAKLINMNKNTLHDIETKENRDFKYQNIVKIAKFLEVQPFEIISKTYMKIDLKSISWILKKLLENGFVQFQK